MFQHYSMKNQPHQKHKLLLQNAHFQVVRLEGLQNYTKFIFQDGSERLMSYTLKNYSESLTFPFLRVSKSCIVNLYFCQNISSESKKIMFKNGSEIQVSRRRFEEVCKNLSNHN